MQRLTDWPTRLIAFIDERAAAPFAWGPNDCCTYAADGVLAITGEDPMPELRGAYIDAAGALRLIAEKSLRDRLAEKFEAIPIGQARRGDVVIVEQEGREVVMIVEGATLVGPGANGAVRLPRKATRAAFKVG